ncbi:LOW QUALITY PROTEIN: hypothetical protein HZS_1642 [Henneguya salminicola]|nr:LOW QUALITY PROTEIN: hypothetical protein HZS_1642 [Henneguya salminicola]
MKRTAEAAYDTVCDSFLNRINLNCNHASCDFDLVSINSFNQRNPCCELTGYLFSLSQKQTINVFAPRLVSLWKRTSFFRVTQKLFDRKWSNGVNNGNIQITISSDDITEIFINNPFLSYIWNQLTRIMVSILITNNLVGGWHRDKS